MLDETAADADADGALKAAAEALAGAEVVVVTAGAGMGVDSGLPDFRGDHGFWKAYPAYQQLGLSFVDLANPRWFVDDAALAWGFYGHRLQLYRRTEPHTGFHALLRLCKRPGVSSFVFTSNVDGAFQRAGYSDDNICEVHGRITKLQCQRPSCTAPWSADGVQVDVDKETLHAKAPLPRCPRCGDVARPNILMFDDAGFDDEQSLWQELRLRKFLEKAVGRRVVVVECGAGEAIPTVRLFGERLQKTHNAVLVRVNLGASHGPPGTLSLPFGARAALGELERHVMGVVDQHAGAGAPAARVL